jgi:hypothetical protein
MCGLRFVHVITVLLELTEYRMSTRRFTFLCICGVTELNHFYRATFCMYGNEGKLAVYANDVMT